MRAKVLAVGLVLLLTAPVLAAAKEFVLRELGVAKEFPVDPVMRQEDYRTPLLGRAVPATVYEAQDDNIIFRFTIADLRALDLAPRSASLYAECVAMAEGEGKVLARMPQRIEDGTEHRVYGQLTSVDLAAGQGRKQTNCFLSKGRLYKVEAVVLPAHGEPNAAAAVRFSTSMRFRIDQVFEDGRQEVGR